MLKFSKSRADVMAVCVNFELQNVATRRKVLLFSIFFLQQTRLVAAVLGGVNHFPPRPTVFTSDAKNRCKSAKVMKLHVNAEAKTKRASNKMEREARPFAFM